MESKQLILVAVKGTMHKPIFGPAIPFVIGAKKRELKPLYKGWEIQVRTPEGYKNVKIYAKSKIDKK